MQAELGDKKQEHPSGALSEYSKSDHSPTNLFIGSAGVLNREILPLAEAYGNICDSWFIIIHLGLS